MIHSSGLTFRAYVRRGAGIWLAVRAIGTAFLLFGIVSSGGRPAAALEPSATIVVITVIGGYLDIRLARERVLLGNLGIPLWQLALPLGAAAVAGELALGIVSVAIR